jgi:hypothetical protein
MLNAILWMPDFIWKSEAMHGTNQGPVIWTFGRSTRVNISDSHFFSGGVCEFENKRQCYALQQLRLVIWIFGWSPRVNISNSHFSGDIFREKLDIFGCLPVSCHDGVATLVAKLQEWAGNIESVSLLDPNVWVVHNISWCLRISGESFDLLQIWGWKEVLIRNCPS